MDTKTILSAFFFLGITAHVSAQIYIPDTKHVNIGVVYPISNSGMQAKAYTNCFSLNLLAGFSGGETGVSLAGLSNIVIDSASGVQIAGFSNIILNRARGLQIAGFANITGNNSGVQLAGFGNFTARSTSGVQVSGFINKAANVNTQVAGFINVAKKVKGVQLAGFINIADSSDYPIALFNYIRDGERTISASIDETLTSLISFRSGGRKLYSITGAGYNHKGRRSLAAWELGLGAHLVSGDRFRLNVEVVSVGLTDFKNGDWTKSSLRVLPAWRLGHRVELFAGPTFNYLYARNGQGDDIVGHYLWSDGNSRHYYGLFFGVTGGITISLTNK